MITTATPNSSANLGDKVVLNPSKPKIQLQVTTPPEQLPEELSQVHLSGRQLPSTRVVSPGEVVKLLPVLRLLPVESSGTVHHHHSVPGL